MLTTVILEGPMGKEFGRKWELYVSSPNEALRMVDANRPGVFAWIKRNINKYERYKVIVETYDGKVEALSNDDYAFERKAKTIRFVPLVEGSGRYGNIVLGAILFVVGFYMPGTWGMAGQALMGAGISMMVGGVIQLLTPQPKTEAGEVERRDKTSYYFDGPANTEVQGVPVQLIYGERVLVGSHAISSSVEINQMME